MSYKRHGPVCKPHLSVPETELHRENTSQLIIVQEELKTDFQELRVFFLQHKKYAL